MRPRLRAVEEDGFTFPSGYHQYKQEADETSSFNGKHFLPDDEWIGGVLYPDHLGIAFAERLADIPQFALQVEAMTGRRITSIRGTASIALPGDPPLLGDWILNGTFDASRLARKFDQELGGYWEIKYYSRDPRAPAKGYNVEINRAPGT